MAKNRLAKLRDEWLPAQWCAIGRMLLLVPEAVLIAVLICLYVAVGQPPLLALLAALLVVSFIARTIALHWASLAVAAARYQEADALVHLALLLYPWSADALALRGALALATGKAEAAETALRRAIALLPDRAPFYAALSSALLELGRPVEAAAAARQALRLDAPCALAYLYLAEAERVYGAAADLIEERLRSGLAVAVVPEATAALHCALASHLLSEKRLSEAALALHSAEALLAHCSLPRQAEIRFFLGELLAEHGQTERARECYRNVEELDPQGRYAAAAWRGARV